MEAATPSLARPSLRREERSAVLETAAAREELLRRCCCSMNETKRTGTEEQRSKLAVVGSHSHQSVSGWLRVCSMTAYVTRDKGGCGPELWTRAARGQVQKAISLPRREANSAAASDGPIAARCFLNAHFGGRDLSASTCRTWTNARSPPWSICWVPRRRFRPVPGTLRIARRELLCSRVDLPIIVACRASVLLGTGRLLVIVSAIGAWFHVYAPPKVRMDSTAHLSHERAVDSLQLGC